MGDFVKYMKEFAESEEGKKLFKEFGDSDHGDGGAPPDPEKIAHELQEMMQRMTGAPFFPADPNAGSATPLPTASSSPFSAPLGPPSSPSSSPSPSTAPPSDLQSALDRALRQVSSSSAAGPSAQGPPFPGFPGLPGFPGFPGMMPPGAPAGGAPGSENLTKEDEEMIQKLMSEFGMSDEKMDPSKMDAMVEEMMSKMMSKEYLSQPMRDICERYPAWLRENQSKYSTEEFRNFEKQYECFQRICKEFDKDPQDSKAVMDLMNELQQYGSPPKDIVKSLLPGLELDSQGMPTGIPNMDPKALEEMAKGDCSVM